MVRHDVPVCECDQCGHRWLQEGAKLPDRCPSRKCRSLRWNLTLMGQVVEKARKVGAVAVQINETVIPTSRCENPKHEGFQRKDGYWCMTCVRLYR